MGLLLEVWPLIPAILATNCHHRVMEHEPVTEMAGMDGISSVSICLQHV